ncbi:MAG: FKBP-type peptidyl-prolyl cis-trans isomerase [Patescibacteria group bacterium]
MNRKNINIIIILALAVVAIFIGLGFMGFGGLGNTTPTETSVGGVQAILNEIQSTGTVADLRVEEITLGTGDAVAVGDTLTVRYIGVLPDGTVFDSTDAHGGVPYTFTIGEGNVIQAWDMGLIGMKEGGRRLLAVPPALGYGAEPFGQIPANATLIFDVELLTRVPAGTPLPSPML